MNQRPFQFRGLAVLLALVLCEPGWAATPTVAPQLPDPGSVGMTKEQQVQLGRQAMAEVYQKMPVLPDSSPQTQYVRQLGKRLADVIDCEGSSERLRLTTEPQRLSQNLNELSSDC